MRRRLALIAVACTLLAVSCGSDGDEMAGPGGNSVEAGFSRDKSTHHAQAVAMAEAIRARTDGPDLKLLATDIALGQQNQIGRMTTVMEDMLAKRGVTS